MSDPLTLALGADAHFAAPLGVALHSALARLEPGDRVRVIVLSLGIDDSDRDQIQSIAERFGAELTWREVDAETAPAHRGRGHFSMASYLRLLFPALAPAEIERVLYLEADVPVMDDLGAVWRCEPEGRPVAGVRDYLVPRLGSPGGVAGVSELGLDPRAGVGFPDRGHRRADHRSQSADEMDHSRVPRDGGRVERSAGFGRGRVRCVRAANRRRNSISGGRPRSGGSTTTGISGNGSCAAIG